MLWYNIDISKIKYYYKQLARSDINIFSIINTCTRFHVALQRYCVYEIQCNKNVSISISIWWNIMYFHQKEEHLASYNCNKVHIYHFSSYTITIFFFYQFSEDQVRSERKTTAIKEIRESYLILIQNMADFVNAISWLPPGLILWSGKLSRFQNGIFGMISSLIMLYRAWPEKEKTS